MTAPGWIELIPDTAERLRWVAAFNGRLDDAVAYRPHFTDPVAAARWANLRTFKSWPDRAGHLHAHGIPADSQLISDTLLDVAGALTGRPRERGNELTYRLTLTLAHPTLTQADHDALFAAAIPVTEIPALLIAGALDHDGLALIGALR